MTLNQGNGMIAWYMIKIQLGIEELWPGHSFRYMCTVTLTSEILPWVKIMTHRWVMDNNWVKYYMHVKSPSLGGRLPIFHKLDMYDFIKVTLGSKDFWPGHRFWVCVRCDLDDMTLGQGHDTPLGHGQQLSTILSRSHLAVRTYGPDTDFEYVCTVTLTLEIWPWVKVMTYPWVIDNNCVKYHPDQTWQWGVMAQTHILGICALWLWH